MDFVDLAAGDVTYGGVAVPTNFIERWRGMKGRTGAMLFRSRSVHGLGMDRDLTVVAIDGRHRVLAVQRLRPGGLLVIGRACFLLELEATTERPTVGSRVRFYDRRHGGTTGRVRDSDRQSG